MGPPAFGQLQEATDKAPKEPSYHCHMGLLHAKNGDAAEALERTLALNPNFDGAADARKTLATLK